MPLVKRRSPGQIANIRSMIAWHQEMAAQLGRSGKTDQARTHLIRANLLEPAVASPTR